MAADEPQWILMDGLLSQERAEELCTSLTEAGSESLSVLNDVEGRYSRYDFLNRELAQELSQQLQELGMELELGPRFYLSQYMDHTEYIEWHVDGVVSLGSKPSQYSLLIYLNEVVEGGETVLDPGDGQGHLLVQPYPGRGLLLAPDLRHCSKPPVSGSKWILRGDVYAT